MKHRLAVNPIACTGHGICAEMLPELIGLDEWGYPILADQPVPHQLSSLARRAVRLCPTLALRIEPVSAERRVPTSATREPAPAGRHSGRNVAPR
ncbi:MAG TPA: ferredoxin [Streptosporangiaceae bacterium]